MTCDTASLSNNDDTMRALLNVEINPMAAEGRRDEGEEVASAAYPTSSAHVFN
jgi:hypothetical protein